MCILISVAECLVKKQTLPFVANCVISVALCERSECFCAMTWVGVGLFSVMCNVLNDTLLLYYCVHGLSGRADTDMICFSNCECLIA